MVEISSLAGNESVAAWLYRHKMISHLTRPYRITANRSWELSGEAATLDFSIRSDSGSKRFIAKCCIKSSSTKVMQEWLRRRDAVTKVGVATPRLYASQGASLVEEFVPYTFSEAFTRGDKYVQRRLVDAFTHTHQLLAQAGFTPVSLHDARSQGSNVVLVDFGSDLGDRRGSSITPEAACEKATAELVSMLGHRAVRPFVEATIQ